jgi:hypothetical protein
MIRDKAFENMLENRKFRLQRSKRTQVEKSTYASKTCKEGSR